MQLVQPQQLEFLLTTDETREKSQNLETLLATSRRRRYAPFSDANRAVINSLTTDEYLNAVDIARVVHLDRAQVTQNFKNLERYPWHFVDKIVSPEKKFYPQGMPLFRLNSQEIITEPVTAFIILSLAQSINDSGVDGGPSAKGILRRTSTIIKGVSPEALREAIEEGIQKGYILHNARHLVAGRERDDEFRLRTPRFMVEREYLRKLSKKSFLSCKARYSKRSVQF